jgi:hypothetical protein
MVERLRNTLAPVLPALDALALVKYLRESSLNPRGCKSMARLLPACIAGLFGVRDNDFPAKSDAKGLSSSVFLFIFRLRLLQISP